MTVPTIAIAADPGSHIRPVLSIRALSKTFIGTKALDGVDLDVAEGEIHGLVGQNGSGKSTLIKVIAGYHLADRGSLAYVNGTEINLSRRAAHDRLRFVHQDLGLIMELGATENLALRGGFLTDRAGRVRWRAQEKLTRTLLDRFGLDIDLQRPLGEVTPVQRTIVAIASALAGWDGGPGVLVLDEPTAVLPPSDVQILLDIVKRVRDRGTSILYVSHRLDEVLEISDRITVLRSGRVVVTRPNEDLDSQALADLMVGSEVDAGYRAGLATPDTNPVVLTARNLRGRYLDGVGIRLAKGEILGVAGLPGSGSNELPYALAGKLSGASGELRIDDGPWTPVSQSRSFNIPLVPADRPREGVIAEFSVAENLSLSSLGRFRKVGLLGHKAERISVRSWIKRVQVKTASLDASILSLSGGNQQKIVLARCLAQDPRVLLLCEPTAGVDVGTRQAIYEFLAERAKAGLSLVVASSDTGDLLALCTRVIVMCNGRITRELTGDEISDAQLVTAMEETEQI